MITTLPDLSYSPTGIIWSEDLHSSANTKPRAYPRTDLRQFLPWHEFEIEVHDMGQRNILPGTQYDIGSLLKKPKKVSDEEGVHHEASNQRHGLVVEVLEILGIEGEFMPTSGSNQTIGAPDFSWLRNNVRHPLLVVRISLTLLILTTLILWCDRPSIKRNGRHLLQTWLGILTNKIRASWRDSRSILCTKYMAT